MESAMDVFENRLESYTNWPKGLYLRPQVMAAAGEEGRIQNPGLNIMLTQVKVFSIPIGTPMRCNASIVPSSLTIGKLMTIHLNSI